MKEKYEISEFVSFQLIEDGEEFIIILKGRQEYKNLIALKVCEIMVTDTELEELKD